MTWSHKTSQVRRWQSGGSQKSHHILPYWSSYELSVVRTWETDDHDKSTAHNNWLGFNVPLAGKLLSFIYSGYCGESKRPFPYNDISFPPSSAPSVDKPVVAIESRCRSYTYIYYIYIYSISLEIYANTGIRLGMHLANERRRYNVTTSLIGWARI